MMRMTTRIARGAGENRVKRGVLDDRGAAGLQLAALRVEDALQIREVIVGDPRGGGAGDGGFEHQPHVEELVAQIVLIGEDRRERRHQAVDVELAGERALPVRVSSRPIVSSMRKASRIEPRLTPKRAASNRSPGSG
jgi:hypothetical protein